MRLGHCIAAALMVAPCARAATPQWVGMTPDYAANSVELFSLSGYAVRGAAVASVSIGKGETVSVDSFRCRPGGTFCIFTTNKGSDSFLYNASVVTGQLNSRTPLPSVTVHNLHVDMATGAAYTVALAANSTRIVSIYAGAMSTLIDLSEYVTRGETVPPAGTTQCSDTDIMWVGVKAAAKGANDRIITVHLPTRTVAGVRSVQGSLPSSLWASCDDSTKVNHLAGALMTDGGASVAYADITDSGEYTTLESAPVPTTGGPYVLSGLLSQPPTWAYFMTLYPASAAPGSNATGYVAFGQNAAGRSLTVQPIDYYLTGAAAIF